ncbi:hypothetical protein [Streptomyces olivaceus]|uniref:hypothetical protein n=1 Tax=Streptomyces olivaceus TaxID=47716 RepID=UPI0033AA86F9
MAHDHHLRQHVDRHTAPAGGTAELAVKDMRGRTIERRKCKDRTPITGASADHYEATRYAYDAAGNLSKVADASERNTWTAVLLGNHLPVGRELRMCERCLDDVCGKAAPHPPLDRPDGADPLGRQPDGVAVIKVPRDGHRRRRHPSPRVHAV